jgi:hypothetical protein
MSEGFELFRGLSSEWLTLGSSRPAKRALCRWAAVEPALTGLGSIAEVVVECHRRGHAAEAAAVLSALLRQAHDPLAARALLQALTPGLVRIVERIRRQFGWVGPLGVWPTMGDASAEVVAYAIEAIRGVAGRSVRWPQSVILDSVWHKVQAAVRRWRRWGCGEAVLQPADDAVNPAAQLAGLIGEAVQRGRVSRADAELVWRYRVADEPARVIAMERGCSPVALRARRERAEQALARLARAS